MHVEACLALAMQDIYTPVSQSQSSSSPPSSSPIQPWFGHWSRPDGKKILIYGSGPNLDAAKQSALSYLKAAGENQAKAADLSLYPAQDPHNPLWSTLTAALSNPSTPNQMAQGVALYVAVAYYFAPSLLPDALGRAIAFCKHQIEVGMMSVARAAKIGGGISIVSEFKPISHLWIWYSAFVYLRWIAVTIKKNKNGGDDGGLVCLTDSLWARLLADMQACGTPDGHVLCCGPRAWSRPDPNKPIPKRFSFQSAAADAIYCEIFQPSLKWPNGKLKGYDMLGALMVRSEIRDYREMLKLSALSLPVTIDHIMYARDNGRVATWLANNECSNNTPPGPLYWSQWENGKLTYGVGNDNAEPRYNLYSISTSMSDNIHPANRKWSVIKSNK